MKTYLSLFTFLVMTISTYAQRTLFHEFEPTASDYKVLKWNINQSNLPRFYIQESVDVLGRVTELKFCENGKIMADQLCYLDSWMKYQYPNDSTIITMSLDLRGNLSGSIECELPSKVTYHLSEDKRLILRTNEEYFIGDTTWYVKNGWTKRDLEKTIKSLMSEQKTHTIIGNYDVSFSKLNGIFPVSKDFVPQYFIDNSPKGLEIQRALKNK